MSTAARFHDMQCSAQRPAGSRWQTPLQTPAASTLAVCRTHPAGLTKGELYFSLSTVKSPCLSLTTGT